MKEGDEAAFSALYQLYAPLLIDFAASRLSSLEEARDIIHDLFVHFWQEREHTSITISLRAFLFAAVRYRIIDHIRRNSTRQKYADTLARLPVIELTSEERLHDKQLQYALQEAVNELAPRMQEVFRLSRFEHFTTAQIAEKLGRSEQTVKNQLTTALSQIRAKLSQWSFLLWWL